MTKYQARTASIFSLEPCDDDDVYLEYYSGKGFHINYSVYMSYVKHINSSNKA
jgi:hypothetical protein